MADLPPGPFPVRPGPLEARADRAFISRDRYLGSRSRAPAAERADGGRSMGEVEVRVTRAELAERGEVLRLLTEAARWARDRGVVGMWEVPYPERWVNPSLERGEVFLARVGPEVVGTLTLRWEDPKVWGDQPPDSGYVHRLAVARRWAGRRVGASLLDWAEGEAARRGRSRLRLDCRTTHAGLRRYYRSLGFAPVGLATVDGVETLLWERPVPPRAP